MRLGVIADDFTGASDIANTLRKGGMATTLICGVVNQFTYDCDAAVIALKSRSIPANAAVEQSLEALALLRRAGCTQFIFKYCSTFDSTPQGNIGPVASALADGLKADKVICCPAFPANGRTVYQGHLFVNGKLLSESGMENHPLNPMTDSNLQRWLQLQCRENIGLVDYSVVRRGPAAIRQALNSSGGRLFITDALTDHDLVTLGQACANEVLITGGSGIALGLPGNFQRRGIINTAQKPFDGVKGSGVVLAGSCSWMTLQQVEHYGKSAPALNVSAFDLMSGAISLQTAIAFAETNRKLSPLIYTSDDAAHINEIYTLYGKEKVSNRIELFFGELARALRNADFNRIVVAGGETSGAVVSALEIQSFEVGPEIAPGVPALRALAPYPLAMALKSGNFGTASFFSEALEALGRSS